MEIAIHSINLLTFSTSTYCKLKLGINLKDIWDLSTLRTCGWLHTLVDGLAHL